ncbi:MAG: hypothetical protein HZA65_07115 [Rhodocyclales bacterium]|nr:hypothetical protein [Rhodocyclales bacterium]
MRPLILLFPLMTSLLAGCASQHQNVQVVVSGNGATQASASADKARTPSPAPNGYAYTYVENYDSTSGEDFLVTHRPRERN